MRTSPRGAIAHKVLLPRNFQIQIQNPIGLFLSFNQLRYPRTMIYLIERFSLEIYNTIYIISSSLNCLESRPTMLITLFCWYGLVSVILV